MGMDIWLYELLPKDAQGEGVEIFCLGKQDNVKEFIEKFRDFIVEEYEEEVTFIVRELDYARYGYFRDVRDLNDVKDLKKLLDDAKSEAFKKHPLSSGFDPDWIKTVYLDPEEMEKTAEIVFNDKKEWNRIVKRFKEELHKGKKVFVYVWW